MNQDQPFSLIRLLLIAIFGNAFLRFEGRQFISEQLFMNSLNQEVAADSIEETEDRILELEDQINLAADSEAKKALETELEQRSITVTDLKEAAAKHDQTEENLNYKGALLNRI